MKYPICNRQAACLTLQYYTSIRRTPQGRSDTVWLLQTGGTIINHQCYAHKMEVG